MAPDSTRPLDDHKQILACASRLTTHPAVAASRTGRPSLRHTSAIRQADKNCRLRQTYKGRSRRPVRSPARDEASLACKLSTGPSLNALDILRH